MHHTVSKTPTAAPIIANNVLSTSSCRAITQRLAPSAARTAISLPRASARASCRFATFAHAIKSTQRSEEHTSELQSRRDLVCRLLLEKKKNRHRGYDQAKRGR